MLVKPPAVNCQCCILHARPAGGRRGGGGGGALGRGRAAHRAAAVGVQRGRRAAGRHPGGRGAHLLVLPAAPVPIAVRCDSGHPARLTRRWSASQRMRCAPAWFACSTCASSTSSRLWASSKAPMLLIGTSEHEVHLFGLHAAHVLVAHCRACGHPARPSCRRSASQSTWCMSARGFGRIGRLQCYVQARIE